MNPYYERAGVQIYHGDNREVVPALGVDVSAVVTDPPYGLSFMGRDWDRHVPGVHFWQVISDAMKPGAHLLSFGGTRTFHRIAVAIEDGGFEIRDTLMWLFGSGFPKSHNLAGDWQGWGTALKPAYEPVIMASKPFKTSVAANVIEHGTGALNIDRCRIEGGGGEHREGEASQERRYADRGGTTFTLTPGPRGGDPKGRWPANIILDEATADALDAQSGRLTSGANPTRRGSNKFANTYGSFVGQAECQPARGKDTGGASRFFYVAKASRAERNAGVEGLEEQPLNWSAGTQNPGSFQSVRTHRSAKNHHPTVKPLALMRWLITLVTPPDGVVLDPFAGSGSTLVAAAQMGTPAIGVELSEEYAEIAARRIDHAIDHLANQLPLMNPVVTP